MKTPITIGLFLLVFGISTLPVSAQIALDPTYCDDEYYSIPGEPERCSRAPNACGNGYDEVNTAELMPNPQSCTSNPNACEGKPPLCCYEMARTGDFTKCVGYWERLWCPQVLCEEAQSNGASDSQCGGSCQCSHAFSSYCGDDVQIVSLEERLGGSAPTITPTTPQGATPTNTPGPSDPTHTPTPTLAPTDDCEAQKLLGNYNCVGGVDEADFNEWFADFTGGSSMLAPFEYWRRASF